MNSFNMSSESLHLISDGKADSIQHRILSNNFSTLPDNPFHKLTTGCCKVYIPAPTTYFCNIKWSQYWQNSCFIRRVITYILFTFCYSSIVMTFYIFVANVTCFSDVIHIIIAVRRLAGAFFALFFTAGIMRGLLGFNTSDFNHPITREVIGLIMKFKLIDGTKNQPAGVNFLFGFWFLTIVSIFLTAIPLLNKNIWPLLVEEGPNNFLLISDLASTAIRIYHYQLFWIICYGVKQIIEDQMEEIVKETENMSKIIQPGNSTEVEEIAGIESKNMDDNLMSMRKFSAEIKDLISIIDEKIRIPVFLGVLETACGVLTPLIFYIKFIYSEGKENIFIHAQHIPWILVRLFIFAYGFLWAIAIPSSYNRFVTRYKMAVYKVLSLKSYQQFEEKFQFTGRELLNEAPCFTIGGFVNMKTFTLMILSAFQLLLGVDIIKTVNEKIVHQNITKLEDYYLPFCEDESAVTTSLPETTTSVFNETFNETFTF